MGETVLNCAKGNSRYPYERSKGGFARREGAVIIGMETCHGMLAATGSWKRQRAHSPLEPPEVVVPTC